MAKPAARLGDNCTGHKCFPPRPIIKASNNVNINGIKAARKGDQLAIHCCSGKCHDGIIANGSRTVNINGRPAARITDQVNCGSKIAQGSGNVFIG